MPDFLTHRYVAHSVDEMFSLVVDVERYPEFVPFCRGHAIKSRRVRDDVELLTTDMTVGHLMFRETFRSFVTLDRANSRILIAAADGPLRRLDGRWIFRNGNSGGCEVGFSLSYELACGGGSDAQGSILQFRSSVRTPGGRRVWKNPASTVRSERSARPATGGHGSCPCCGID